MITGEAAGEAVELARSHPRLAVGLHLVLVDGRPALPPAEVPDLTGGRDAFPFAPVRTGLRLQFTPRAREQARLEIRTQLERFRETGLPLAHVNGHHHFHMHPAVMSILAELAGEFRIPRIRLPREELRLAISADRRSPASKLLWSAIFRGLRAHAEKTLRGTGIAACDRVYGLLCTGRITEGYLLALLPRIPPGTVEIFLHPADPYPGESLNGPPGSGRAELAAMTSLAVGRAIAVSGFSLAPPPAGPEAAG